MRRAELATAKRFFLCALLERLSCLSEFAWRRRIPANRGVRALPLCNLEIAVSSRTATPTGFLLHLWLMRENRCRGNLSPSVSSALRCRQVAAFADASGSTVGTSPQGNWRVEGGGLECLQREYNEKIGSINDLVMDKSARSAADGRRLPRPGRALGGRRSTR